MHWIFLFKEHGYPSEPAIPERRQYVQAIAPLLGPSLLGALMWRSGPAEAARGLHLRFRKRRKSLQVCLDSSSIEHFFSRPWYQLVLESPSWS